MAVLSPRGLLRAAAAATGLAVAVACGGPADEIVVLHSANGYGYFEDCGCVADSSGGLAKRAWVVDSLRRSLDEPIVLVDAGDFTGGDNAYGAALGKATVAAMELMGYDALTLGEWDLNQGTGYLREILADSPIAWVHTNYDVVGLEELGHETLVLERGGRRIGLLGLFNPTILLNPTMRDSVVVEEDVVASAERGVRRLREQGVDAIVVISHLSYRADLALARLVDGIDLVVSGHGGKSLDVAEEVVPGTWVVAPGDLGRFLGSAEIAFAGGEEVRVEGVEGGLIVMEPGLPDDPRLEPLFARYEEEARGLLRREMGAREAAEREATREEAEGAAAERGRPD